MKRRYIGYGAVGAILLAGFAREGCFGSACTADLTWAHHESTRKSKSEAESWSYPNDPLLPPISCEIAACDKFCTHVREGFDRAFPCHSIPGAPTRVHLLLVADDAFCYVPLYKSARVPYKVTIDVTGHGKDRARATVHGDVDQTTTGIASCRVFNHNVGAVIATDVREQLEKMGLRTP